MRASVLILAGGEISLYRARSLRTCWGLRPRRAVQALALARPSVLPSTQRTVSASRGCCFRGSIPSLCAPLSTLRRSPRGHQRMTRGQCGSLDLHWQRLALLTPCRSPRRTRCQVKQPQREMGPDLPFARPYNLCLGYNRSWFAKRKLDKASPCAHPTRRGDTTHRARSPCMRLCAGHPGVNS